jgi:SAM-dependent methyltransferase
LRADLDIYLQANDWDSRLQKELPAIDRIIELHRGKGKLRILDVGCGPGIHLHALAKRYPQHDFSGIDIDAVRIEHARAAAANEHLPISFVTGDFTEHAFLPRATYDIIFSIGNSIALVWGCGNVGAVIEQVSGLLESGGYFLFQIQNNEKPKRGYTTSRSMKLDNGEDCFTAKRYEPDLDLHVMRVEFLTFTRHPGDVKHAVQVEAYSWHLIPRGDIEALLGRHGFTRVEAWADYSGAPFEPATSDDLVVLAKKALGESMLCDGKGMRVPSRLR